MAEIRVEEKRGQGMRWLWLLILLLVVIAVVWFMSNSTVTDTGTTEADVVTPLDSVNFTPEGARLPPPVRAA